MPNNIIGNTFEDFTDDLLTTVVMKNAKDAFDPLRKEFDKEPDAFHQALASAVSTLQMGVSMLAIRYVTTTLLPNLGVRAFSLYSYIISANVTKALRLRMQGKFNNIKSGRVAKGLLSMLSDGQEQRGQRAKIANDLVSHMEIMQIKKEKISNDTRLGFDKTITDFSSQSSSKYIMQYTEKTKLGNWTSSAQDKAIYEKAVGKINAGTTWSKIYKKLNTFSQFAIDAEEKVVNQAQVQFDTFSAQGHTKI